MYYLYKIHTCLNIELDLYQDGNLLLGSIWGRRVVKTTHILVWDEFFIQYNCENLARYVVLSVKFLKPFKNFLPVIIFENGFFFTNLRLIAHNILHFSNTCKR